MTVWASEVTSEQTWGHSAGRALARPGKREWGAERGMWRPGFSADLGFVSGVLGRGTPPVRRGTVCLLRVHIGCFSRNWLAVGGKESGETEGGGPGPRRQHVELKVWVAACFLMKDPRLCSFKQTRLLHNRHSFQWRNSRPWPWPWLIPHPFLFLTLLPGSFIIHSPLLSSPHLSDLMHIVVCLAKTSSKLRWSDLFVAVWFQASEDVRGGLVCKTGEMQCPAPHSSSLTPRAINPEMPPKNAWPPLHTVEKPCLEPWWCLLHRPSLGHLGSCSRISCAFLILRHLQPEGAWGLPVTK